MFTERILLWYILTSYCCHISVTRNLSLYCWSNFFSLFKYSGKVPSSSCCSCFFNWASLSLYILKFKVKSIWSWTELNTREKLSILPFHKQTEATNWQQASNFWNVTYSIIIGINLHTPTIRQRGLFILYTEKHPFFNIIKYQAIMNTIQWSIPKRENIELKGMYTRVPYGIINYFLSRFLHLLIKSQVHVFKDTHCSLISVYSSSFLIISVSLASSVSTKSTTIWLQ